MRVGGVGAVLVDQLLFVPTYPQEDVTVPVSRHERQVGGPVLQRLAFHAALGDETFFVGAVGTDETGRNIHEGLQHLGVSTEWLRVQHGRSSGFSSAWLSEETGSRTIAYSVGSLQPLSAADLPQNLLDDVELLHIDAREPAAAIAAAESAALKGVMVSHDTGSPKPHSEQLLRVSDVVQAPLMFARRVFGIHDMVQAAEKILSFGPKVAVVTDGRRGAGYASTSGSGHRASFDVPSVSSIGAGDRFGGALSYALIRGREVVEAVDFACAAAALRTTTVIAASVTEVEIDEVIVRAPRITG